VLRKVQQETVRCGREQRDLCSGLEAIHPVGNILKLVTSLRRLLG
jgi:hypothetical protein